MIRTQRILVPTADRDSGQAWWSALRHADSICADYRGPTPGIVLMLQYVSELLNTDLTRWVGEADARRLYDEKGIKLPSGATLRCLDQRYMEGDPSAPCVIIVYRATAKMLDRVESLKGFVGIVVVPEDRSEIRRWERRWTPVIDGEIDEASQKAEFDDPVVEKAMRSLKAVVGGGTGIRVGHHKDHAKVIFRILRYKGHQASEASIKAWAIRRGWRPSDASELAALAAKLLNQKTRPSPATIGNWQQWYDLWQ